MKRDGWENYWHNESRDGEVFLSSNGDKNTELDFFWKDLFKHKSNKSVLDIACGAGSIYKALSQDHSLLLHASDSSQAALTILKNRQPEVNVYECDLNELPSKITNIDLIVSQFGIEYGGALAFNILPKILQKGGEFRLLCHYRGGEIDKNTLAELKAIELVESTGFLKLVNKLFINDDKSTIVKFQEIEPIIHKSLSDFNNSILNQAYFGFRKLYCNKQHYLTQDLVDWVNKIEEAKNLSYSRLSLMNKACLDEKRLEEIKNKLLSTGIKECEFKPFYISNHTEPLAWEVRGTSAE